MSKGDKYSDTTSTAQVNAAILWIFDSWSDTTATNVSKDTCNFLRMMTEEDWKHVVKCYIITFVPTLGSIMLEKDIPYVRFDIEFPAKNNATYYCKYRIVDSTNANYAFWFNTFGKTWNNSDEWQKKSS